MRIGVATSDPDGILATPVETVPARPSRGKHLRRLVALIDEFDVVEVVVGLPRTLADRAGPSAHDAIAVADALAARIPTIPVRLADERLTTVTAQRSLREAGVRAKATAVDDRPGGRGRHPADLAGPAPARAATTRVERPMADDWARERTEPEAVGRPERRSAPHRSGPARARNRRRAQEHSHLAVLAVLVVGRGGAVLPRLELVAHVGSATTRATVRATSSSRSTTATRPPRSARRCRTATSSPRGRKFVDAAEGNSAISAIQPGFYKMRTEISAANAVSRLADPQNRVGKLVIPEGRQLDDIADVKTNAVTEGIFSLIAHATCVDLDGEQQCGVTADDLQTAAANADAAALASRRGPLDQVKALGGDHRRLEGLIAPGTWNIDPSAPAAGHPGDT